MTVRLLRGPFVPAAAENHMKHVGDVRRARENFLERRFRNLDALLHQRYHWMNEHIRDGETVIDIGCGAGFSQIYIRKGTLVATDYLASPWADVTFDALKLPFAADSIDVFLCSHMIHHLASPISFLESLAVCLRPGGRILIQDLETSLALRILLRAMRHEGWSYDIDVFDPAAVANDPADPWSANCAIPHLLFSDERKFEQALPQLRIRRNELNEFLLFPLSGGVIAKTPVPELPEAALRRVRGIDKALVALMPACFAMGRSVVLEKSATN